jgi:hypothetical protein
MKNNLSEQNVWYHIFSYPVKAGFILKPLRKQRLERDMDSNIGRVADGSKRCYFIEEIFEEIREREFPRKPSRLNSIYVYDYESLQRAKFDLQEGDEIGVIKSESKIWHKTDMDFYNMAVQRTFWHRTEERFREDFSLLKEIKELAQLYWKGEKRKNAAAPCPEIILLGEGTVEKIV